MILLVNNGLLGYLQLKNHFDNLNAKQLKNVKKEFGVNIINLLEKLFIILARTLVSAYGMLMSVRLSVTLFG